MGPLFARLVDDAALFPPARAGMGEALPAYRTAVRGPVPGRFLCPADRAGELRAHLVPDDLLDLGLIAGPDAARDLPEALETLGAEPRVRLTSVEIVLPRHADQARATSVTIARHPDVPTYIEMRRAPGRLESLDRIAAARGTGAALGARLRTGGPDPKSFPAPSEVAAFVSACAERGVPFKCTAGLHHAVRRLGHHGFLNLLLATCQAAAGAHGSLERTLDRTDAAGLARDAARLTDEEVRTTRGLLVAFGSCDIDTPRADLRRLGLAESSGGEGDGG